VGQSMTINRDRPNRYLPECLAHICSIGAIWIFLYALLRSYRLHAIPSEEVYESLYIDTALVMLYVGATIAGGLLVCISAAICLKRGTGGRARVWAWITCCLAVITMACFILHPWLGFFAD